MIRTRLVGIALAIPIGLASLLVAGPALACSVCVGGDPNSSMNQGLDAGVLVLLGVIGIVLSGFASLFLFWMRRAALLEARRVEEVKRASQSVPSGSGASFSTA